MRFLKRVLRRLAAPFLGVFKRYFDERLRDMENRLAERVERVAVTGSASTALAELLTHLGQRLRQLVEETREQGARIEALEDSWRSSRLGTGRVDEARAAGGAEIAGVDDTILSLPYIFTALANVAPGASVLVADGRASTIPVSLAALGFQVTPWERDAAPPDRPNPETRSPSPLFDAIVCSSFLERLGLDATTDEYPDVDADLRAMEALATRARSDGWLVLTAPFGRFDVGPAQRTYDRPAIDRMLRRWVVHDLRLGFLRDRTWRTATGFDREDEILHAGWPALVLVRARRSRSSNDV